MQETRSTCGLRNPSSVAANAATSDPTSQPRLPHLRINPGQTTKGAPHCSQVQEAIHAGPHPRSRRSYLSLVPASPCAPSAFLCPRCCDPQNRRGRCPAAGLRRPPTAPLQQVHRSQLCLNCHELRKTLGFIPFPSSPRFAERPAIPRPEAMLANAAQILASSSGTPARCQRPRNLSASQHVRVAQLERPSIPKSQRVRA